MKSIYLIVLCNFIYFLNVSAQKKYSFDSRLMPNHEYKIVTESSDSAIMIGPKNAKAMTVKIIEMSNKEAKSRKSLDVATIKTKKFGNEGIPFVYSVDTVIIPLGSVVGPSPKDFLGIKCYGKIYDVQITFDSIVNAKTEFAKLFAKSNMNSINQNIYPKNKIAVGDSFNIPRTVIGNPKYFFGDLIVRLDSVTNNIAHFSYIEKIIPNNTAINGKSTQLNKSEIGSIKYDLDKRYTVLRESTSVQENESNINGEKCIIVNIHTSSIKYYIQKI
jgi:hypothetical protein